MESNLATRDKDGQLKVQIKNLVKKYAKTEKDERKLFRSIISEISALIQNKRNLTNLTYLSMLNLTKHEIYATPNLFEILWEGILSSSFRKNKGQYSTPLDISKFMALWSLSHLSQNKEISVLDPAIGSGTLVYSLFDNLKTYNFAKLELVGFDIDNLMLQASKINISRLNKPITLIDSDFLLYDDYKDKFNLVIMNPPYYKHHYIANKEQLFSNFNDKFNINLSGLTSYHVLFLIRATPLLKKDGLLVAITPSDHLNAGYGKEVKKFLLDNFEIKYLIYLGSDNLTFTDGMSSACISLLKKKKSQNGHKVKFIHISEKPDFEILMESISKAEIENTSMNLTEIRQSDLEPNEKWLKYFFPELINIDKKKLIKLGEIASTKRGIATGANKYFTLSEEEIAKWKIPNKYLKPIITKANMCNSLLFNKSDFDLLKKNNKKVFLLNILDSKSKNDLSDNLQKYIEEGKKLGYHERYLTRNRNVWYSMEQRETAPIWIKIFNREGLQFILNESSSVHLTCFHSIYPDFSDSKMLRFFVLFLNSNLGRTLSKMEKRLYGGGLTKLEPKDVENIFIIDPHLIDKQQLESANLLFEEFNDAIKNNEDLKKMNIKIDAYLQYVLKKIPTPPKKRKKERIIQQSRPLDEFFSN